MPRSRSGIDHVVNTQGVMVTHANLIANSAGYINLLETKPDEPGLLPGRACDDDVC